MPDLTIVINEDKECYKCGDLGVTQNGLCLSCVGLGIKDGEYDDIIKGEQMSTATQNMIDNNVETKTIVKSLPCTLTREESHNYAKECARLIREREKVEAEKKDKNNEFKERIDAINNKASDISEKVNANQEYRDVDCHQLFDYLQMTVRSTRLDTGEEIECRRMTSKEAQRPLFGGEE